jgi:hypothetical protein
MGLWLSRYVYIYITYLQHIIEIQVYKLVILNPHVIARGRVPRYRTEGLSAVAGYDFTAIEAAVLTSGAWRVRWRAIFM